MKSMNNTEPLPASVPAFSTEHEGELEENANRWQRNLQWMKEQGTYSPAELEAARRQEAKARQRLLSYKAQADLLRKLDDLITLAESYGYIASSPDHGPEEALEAKKTLHQATVAWKKWLEENVR